MNGNWIGIGVEIGIFCASGIRIRIRIRIESSGIAIEHYEKSGIIIMYTWAVAFISHSIHCICEICKLDLSKHNWAQ